tara:strand:- start:8608 stop:9303 length:696 start_codon:yes stop_codon:yes gene_type:complete
MGHAGRHTYKDCINNLYDKVDKNIFKNRLLHLKTREGEEKIAEEIKTFCEDRDIRVLETIENIVHHSENHLTHSAGYFKDIYKSYSDPKIKKEKYSFWVEDDELLQTSGIELADAIKKSIDFLEKNPDTICVRFNRAKDFGEPDSDFLIEDDDIFTQSIISTENGPTFTFQPNINVTEIVLDTWEEAQMYLEDLDTYHCEIVSGGLLKKRTNSKTPFSFFNTNKVYSKTIG